MPDIDEEDAAALEVRGGGEGQEEDEVVDQTTQAETDPDAETQGSEDGDEDSSASNDAGSESGADTGQTSEKPKGDWIPKGRFDEAWGKMRAAERERDEHRAENVALKREVASLKQQLEEAQKPAAQELREPKLEDFDYDQAKHAEALVEYRVQKRLSDEKSQREQKEQAEAERRRQEEQKRLIGGFLSQAKERAAKDEAYAKAVERHGDLPYNEALLDRVLRAKDAAAIDAFFYSNLDEFERINALPKEDAIEELALLKLKLKQSAKTTPGATQQRKQSSAPPPFRQPVVASASSARDPDVEAFTIR